MQAPKMKPFALLNVAQPLSLTTFMVHHNHVFYMEAVRVAEKVLFSSVIEGNENVLMVHDVKAFGSTDLTD